MNVVTSAQMREMDRLAIEQFYLPGPVLMENAGAAVVEAIQVAFGDVRGKRITIYCGGGNNGGDGYVCARLLALRGAVCKVILLVDEEKIHGDALAHFRILKSMAVVEITRYAPESSQHKLAGLIIDALLGTGLKHGPNGEYAQAISDINRLREQIPVVSVDIPSGVDADTGEVLSVAIEARLTVTFGRPKPGHYLFPGAACVGRLQTSDIGFDWDQVSIGSACELIEPAAVAKIVKPRRANSNKGDYGHVGIIAGSRGMAGAPALVSRAAQRIGAGLVTLLTAASVQPIVASKLDEQMTVALSEVEGSVGLGAFETITAFASRASVLCIGPGLTTHPETVALVNRLITEIPIPIVLDADGINALALHPETAQLRANATGATLIMTPHPGEAARLLGTSIAQIESNRLESVRALSERYHAVVLLKGRYTLICGTDGVIRLNTTGNPGMATGGMGDTLTGMVGGLLAQAVAVSRHIEPTDPSSVHATTVAAVCAAVYLHGLAGDLAARQIGEVGIVAGDIIDRLPTVMNEMQRQTNREDWHIL